MEKIGVQGIAKLARKAITQIARAKLKETHVEIAVAIDEGNENRSRRLTFTFFDAYSDNCSLSIYDFYDVKKANSRFILAIEIAKLDSLDLAKQKIKELDIAEEKELGIA
jgi:hypothetical protein